jgi:hypothetical protein
MNRRTAIATGLTGVAALAPARTEAQEPTMQFTSQTRVDDVTGAARYLKGIGDGTFPGLHKGGIIDGFSLTPSPEGGFDLLVVYRIKDAPTP